MQWDASKYGAHAETATAGTAAEWYFAEGAGGGYFTTFFLLAMYFGQRTAVAGWHGVGGVTTPSREWLLAEGATGPYFTTYVLLANPNPPGRQFQRNGCR